MRRCRNCRVDLHQGQCFFSRERFFCRDCWRLVVLMPTLAFLAEHLGELLWKHCFGG